MVDVFSPEITSLVLDGLLSLCDVCILYSIDC